MRTASQMRSGANAHFIQTGVAFSRNPAFNASHFDKCFGPRPHRRKRTWRKIG
jgi:hypothetical protein